MKHLKEHPTAWLDKLTAHKVAVKQTVKHGRKNIQPRMSYSFGKTEGFLARGITPVDLGIYNNKPLESTLSKQRYTGGSKTRIIWLSGSMGTRYGSFPKGE